MEPRKKTSPQLFARPQALGLPPRPLAAQAQRGARLPTAAALQLALISSLLVGGAMLGGCSAGADEGIQSDVVRRPATRVAQQTPPTTTASASIAPAVAPPIDPEPRHVKGEMAPVMPTAEAPPPTAKTPTTTGTAAAVPTSIPRRLGGKPSMVLPTGGLGAAPSPSTPPCDKPVSPESS